jgi:hypothetical protein
MTYRGVSFGRFDKPISAIEQWGGGSAVRENTSQGRGGLHHYCTGIDRVMGKCGHNQPIAVRDWFCTDRKSHLFPVCADSWLDRVGSAGHNVAYPSLSLAIEFYRNHRPDCCVYAHVLYDSLCGLGRRTIVLVGTPCRQAAFELGRLLQVGFLTGCAA